MKQSLQDGVEAERDLRDDTDLSDEVKKFVKMERNKVYNPAISTEEVAEKFDVGMETAHDALDASPYLEKKPVGDQHIWW